MQQLLLALVPTAVLGCTLHSGGRFGYATGHSVYDLPVTPPASIASLKHLSTMELVDASSDLVQAIRTRADIVADDFVALAKATTKLLDECVASAGHGAGRPGKILELLHDLKKPPLWSPLTPFEMTLELIDKHAIEPDALRRLTVFEVNLFMLLVSHCDRLSDGLVFDACQRVSLWCSRPCWILLDIAKNLARRLKGALLAQHEQRAVDVASFSAPLLKDLWLPTVTRFLADMQVRRVLHLSPRRFTLDSIVGLEEERMSLHLFFSEVLIVFQVASGRMSHRPRDTYIAEAVARGDRGFAKYLSGDATDEELRRRFPGPSAANDRMAQRTAAAGGLVFTAAFIPSLFFHIEPGLVSIGHLNLFSELSSVSPFSESPTLCQIVGRRLMFKSVVCGYIMRPIADDLLCHGFQKLRLSSPSSTELLPEDMVLLFLSGRAKARRVPRSELYPLWIAFSTPAERHVAFSAYYLPLDIVVLRIRPQ